MNNRQSSLLYASKFLIAFVIATSCNATENKQEHKPKENTSNQETMKDTIKDFNDALDLNLKDAINKYGEPQGRETFKLDDFIPGIREGLRNIYTLEERLSDSITLEEVTWEKAQDTNITVWYEIQENRAIPKDTFEWNKYAEF